MHHHARELDAVSSESVRDARAGEMTPRGLGPFAAVGLVFFANGALYASWVARLPTVREALGASERTLGFVLLSAAGGAIVAFRVAGALVAARGSRIVTRWSALGLCAAIPFIGLVKTPWALGALLAGLGASSGLMDVAMNANGVEVERALRRPVLGKLHGLFSLGGLTGAATGAIAAERHVGLALHLASVAALLAVLVVVATAAFLVEPRPAAPTAAPGARTRAPRLLGLGVIAFCSSIGEGAMADWSAIYLRDLLGTSAAVAALGYAVFSLAMLTGRFGGDRVTARLGDARVVRIAGGLVAGGLGAGLALHGVPAMMGGIAAAGLGLSVMVPIVFRAGADDGDASPGAALATIATLSYGGFLVGPPTIGLLAARYTLRGALVVVVALALLAAALAPLARPRATQR